MKLSLTLISILLTLAAVAGNQPDTTKTYNLGEVVVTAEHDRLSPAGSTIEVSSTAFRRMDADNAAEALRMSTGVFVKTNSRNEALVSIRGFDQRQIAVFFDGAPIYVPYDGLVDLGELSVAPIGKVIVTKGFSSMLYGANAMGGTINLVTAETRSGISGTLRLQGGPARSIELTHGGADGNIYWFASGNYARSEGITLPRSTPAMRNEDGGTRNNSQFGGFSAFGKVGVEFGDLHAAVSLFHTESDKGIPPQVSTTRPRYWRFTEWKKSIANLAHQWTPTNFLVLKGNVFYEKYRNVLDSYDDATYTTQRSKSAFHSTFDDHSLGASLSATVATPLFEPTRLAFLYKHDVHTEQDNAGNPFKRFNASTLTIGVEQELEIAGDLVALVGVHHDRLIPLFANSAALRPSEGSWNAQAGMAWRVTEALRMHAQIARKNRFPTLKELYSEALGKNVANPQLASERSVNTELGITLRLDSAASVCTSVFNNNVADLVQIVQLGGGKQQFQNIGTARMTGVEFEVQHETPVGLGTLSYTFLDAKNTTFAAASNKLEYKPEHVLHLGLTDSYETGLSWSVEASYVANQHAVDPDSRKWTRLREYLLLGARASQTLLGNAKGFVRINNITDTYYETEYGFPQAGRNIVFGIEATL
ncbi:MAG: TonB-dependent receptor [Ignavibacteriae bacterium]|nr:TonB-dependent receptor [Ignavibacteriota bacterium]